MHIDSKRKNVVQSFDKHPSGYFNVSYVRYGSVFVFKGRGTNNENPEVQFDCTSVKTAPRSPTKSVAVNLTWEEWDQLVAHVESRRPAKPTPTFPTLSEAVRHTLTTGERSSTTQVLTRAAIEEATEKP